MYLVVDRLVAAGSLILKDGFEILDLAHWIRLRKSCPDSRSLPHRSRRLLRDLLIGFNVCEFQKADLVELLSVRNSVALIVGHITEICRKSLVFKLQTRQNVHMVKMEFSVYRTCVWAWWLVRKRRYMVEGAVGLASVGVWDAVASWVWCTSLDIRSRAMFYFLSGD